MGIHIWLLLFISILCCSTIDVAPVGNKTMSYIITHDHMLKPNNVILFIWQQESLKPCDIEKPPDARLENKAFIQFGFIPYLCVILYDASLRYILANKSHADNSLVSHDIAQTIINEIKPEKFCQKMKENSWYTTIDANKLWVSRFNASMKDGLSCQRYCVSDIVNPLCAYALWLDVAIKSADHVATQTQSSNNQGSPVVGQTRQDAAEQSIAVANSNGNRKLNAPSEEYNSESLGTKQRHHVPPVIQSGAAISGQQHAAPITGENTVPSTDGAASRAGVAVPAKDSEIPGQFSNYKKDAHSVPNTSHKGNEQPRLEDRQGGGRTNNQITLPQGHLNKDSSQDIGFEEGGIPQSVVSSDPHIESREHKTNNRVAIQEHFTQGMEPPSSPHEVEGTDQANQERKPDQKSSVQQIVKSSEGTGQALTSKAINEPSTSLVDLNDQFNIKVKDVQTYSQNQSPGDQMNSLPTENLQKAEAEEANKPGKENVRPQVPEAQKNKGPEVANGEQAGKEPSPIARQQNEQSNTEGADQVEGVLNGGVSGEPDNFEKLKTLDDGSLGSRGDEVDSAGDAHRGLDQPVEADEDVFGDRKDAATEEARFGGEGEDPAQKHNTSPKFSDYGASEEEEDDPLPVNDEQEKGQNDADAGAYAHVVDAEDSHFFAYFMTMIILCIIGYLIFHNKQKILALALEGRVRKGSRRRPSTSGYRKLDSNLEEAVTSNCAGPSVTHVIY